MHTDYHSTAIRQLRDHLLHCESREQSLKHMDHAERLLAELTVDQEYCYEDLCRRIAGSRPGPHHEKRLTGREARHDLGLLVEDLSESASIAAGDAGQEVLTVEQLSKQLRVSTKTIARWRRRGLVSRWFVFDGRMRVGFLASSIRQFVEKNQERVRRGTQFSQLTGEERIQLIERARRLAQAGGCPSEITKRLARFTGRNPETIRYTLRQFDRDNPRQAIFPDRAGPLQEETKRSIYQHYRRGETIQTLARRFCRTKTSISRILREVRAKRILDLPLEYMPNEQFAEVRTEAQEKKIIGPTPPGDPRARLPKAPKNVPPYLASLYEIPLLTREQELHLFRKMNYLKYKASKLREKLDLSRPGTGLMDQIERLYDDSVAVKNEIVSANLRLVVSVAKRYLEPGENFFELVSDGNISLIRAVEKFDFARGNKLSTYATWALMKNFARAIPHELQRRGRFRTSSGEIFADLEDSGSDPNEMESAQVRRSAQIARVLAQLDERERKIIVERFGFGPDREPLTLKELGAELQVSKERTRQLETRALNKLRAAILREKIELPEQDVVQ